MNRNIIDNLWIGNPVEIIVDGQFVYYVVSPELVLVKPFVPNPNKPEEKDYTRYIDVKEELEGKKVIFPIQYTDLSKPNKKGKYGSYTSYDKVLLTNDVNRKVSNLMSFRTFYENVFNKEPDDFMTYEGALQLITDYNCYAGEKVVLSPFSKEAEKQIAEIIMKREHPGLFFNVSYRSNERKYKR